MKRRLEEAVFELTEKAKGTRSSIEAMQFTQAALNATNALINVWSIGHEEAKLNMMRQPAPCEPKVEQEEERA